MRSWQVAVAALGVLAAVAVGAPAATAADQVQGVDAPAGGETIDWGQVASAGYEFAAIKATEGTSYTNPSFAGEEAGAKAAGLYVAGYHFATPGASSGAAQADYAVDGSKYVQDGETLPITLDIEYNPTGAECYGLSQGSMVDWVTAFSDEVRARTGHLPIVFTTADWWETCTGGSAALADNPLWTVRSPTGAAVLPSGWTTWTFVDDGSATVPGIPGTTGIVAFNGDEADLAALAGK